MNGPLQQTETNEVLWKNYVNTHDHGGLYTSLTLEITYPINEKIPFIEKIPINDLLPV